MARNKWDKLKSYDRDGFDENGYDGNGFDRNGIHKETGTFFDSNGYDMYGYDEKGFNEYGYTREGLSKEEMSSISISEIESGIEYDKNYGFEDYKWEVDYTYEAKMRRNRRIPDDYQRGNIFRFINKYTNQPYDRKGFCINGTSYHHIAMYNGRRSKGFISGGYYHPSGFEEGYTVIIGEDTSYYDSDAYNKYGFNKEGVNCYGYDERGFNIEDNPRGEEGAFGKKGKHFLTGTDRDPQGYDIRGMNERGFYKYLDINTITKTKYDENGFDWRGFDTEGINMETHEKYDTEGYDVNGYDKDGYNGDGYNREEFDRKGIHKETGTLFNKEGYDVKGYNRDGYDREGFDIEGIHRGTGTLYNYSGYDKKGFKRNGIHKETKTEYDPEGYDVKGYDKDGYDRAGFDREGIHKETREKYDTEGYDVNGVDKEGYDKEGYDCLGINKKGINKETGERDERLAFVEEFLGSDKSIEQFATLKGLSIEEVEEKIQEIRKSPYYASEIDKALKRNSDRYLATIKTLIEKLVAGEISIKEIVGIEEVLKKANNDDREKIFKLLVNQVGTHDTSIMEYAKIFKIKGLDKNLPQNIITKLNEINNSVKYSPDRTIKSKMKDIFKEISRVKAYVAPYIPSEGERIGFIKPGEKDVTMYDITDEERDIARQYLIAKNEFICNKTMQETFKLVVTGEINREIINGITQNSKSARSLAKAVAKDVTVSEAMQGQEFLDLITNEKQIEGDGKDDKN